jgi:LacI family transcriptional regulator
MIDWGRRGWFPRKDRFMVESEVATKSAVDVALPPSPKAAKPVNLRDVAKRAKVSVATVSMVLNENPRISRATQMRVQQIIELMGYRPNRLAQGLSSRYTGVLAVMLPALRHGFGDAYFGELISGICDRAGKLGHKVMLEQAKPDFIKNRDHIANYERRFVDGTLCLGCSDRHHFLADFTDRKYPLIIVDNYMQQWNLDYVVCDYRAGTEQVMNYLLQLGHRKIGFINAAREVRTARDRQEVYENRLRSVNVQIKPEWIGDGQFTEQGGASAAKRILEAAPDITAIFAGNDKMALGAMHYCGQLGIRIPEDVSIIGFDDMQQAAFVNPSLTSVHLPLYEVGALACERLIERIRGKIDCVAETLPTHLVLRESTAMVAQR